MQNFGLEFNVLLVDADLRQFNVVRQFFEKSGRVVEIQWTDSVEALREVLPEYSRHDLFDGPDLIIADPLMDGARRPKVILDLLKTAFPKTTVIISSDLRGFELERLIEQKSPGFIHFSKPMDCKRLWMLLRGFDPGPRAEAA